MSTILDAQYNIATGVTIAGSGTASHFQQRIEMSIVAAAINIQAEVTTTANHANRSNFARSVLSNPSTYIVAFALALASQGLDDTATDASINNTVSAVWNALAGTT